MVAQTKPTEGPAPRAVFPLQGGVDVNDPWTDSATRGFKPGKNYWSALAQVQAKLRPVVKDSENPHHKSKYADLASIWEEVREPMHEAGLVITQVPTVLGQQFVLLTRLVHVETGEEQTSIFPLTPEKNTYQGLGSAITYAKRYAMSAMLGVVTDDDDGQLATNEQQARVRDERRQVQRTEKQAAKTASRGDADAVLARYQIDAEGECARMVHAIYRHRDEGRLVQYREDTIKPFVDSGRATDVEKNVLARCYTAQRERLQALAKPSKKMDERMERQRRIAAEQGA